MWQPCSAVMREGEQDRDREGGAGKFMSIKFILLFLEVVRLLWLHKDEEVFDVGVLEPWSSCFTSSRLLSDCVGCQIV